MASLASGLAKKKDAKTPEPTRDSADPIAKAKADGLSAGIDMFAQLTQAMNSSREGAAKAAGAEADAQTKQANAVSAALQAQGQKQKNQAEAGKAVQEGVVGPPAEQAQLPSEGTLSRAIQNIEVAEQQRQANKSNVSQVLEALGSELKESRTKLEGEAPNFIEKLLGVLTAFVTGNPRASQLFTGADRRAEIAGLRSAELQVALKKAGLDISAGGAGSGGGGGAGSRNALLGRLFTAQAQQEEGARSRRFQASESALTRAARASQAGLDRAARAAESDKERKHEVQMDRTRANRAVLKASKERQQKVSDVALAHERDLEKTKLSAAESRKTKTTPTVKESAARKAGFQEGIDIMELHTSSTDPGALVKNTVFPKLIAGVLADDAESRAEILGELVHELVGEEDPISVLEKAHEASFAVTRRIAQIRTTGVGDTSIVEDALASVRTAFNDAVSDVKRAVIEQGVGGRGSAEVRFLNAQGLTRKQAVDSASELHGFMSGAIANPMSISSAPLRKVILSNFGSVGEVRSAFNAMIEDEKKELARTNPEDAEDIFRFQIKSAGDLSGATFGGTSISPSKLAKLARAALNTKGAFLAKSRKTGKTILTDAAIEAYGEFTGDKERAKHPTLKPIILPMIMQLSKALDLNLRSDVSSQLHGVIDKAFSR